MIRRPDGADFLLIAQHDHALLSGRLADLIGGEAFAPPDPRLATIGGIASHDSGWPLHDDAPTLNAARIPLHVFEISMPLAAKVWSESVRRAAEHAPYACLLVSLHVLALSELARHHDASPHERERSAQDVFAINKFQHKQVELQEQLRNAIGLRTDLPLHFGLAKVGSDPREDQLRRNFRLLTAVDRISLQLCCDKPLFPEIEEVYPRASASPISLKLHPETNAVLIHPWPFNVRKIIETVPARRVSAKPFVEEASFRAAYARSPVEKIAFEIRPR